MNAPDAVGNRLADQPVIVYDDFGRIVRESFGRDLSRLETALCDALDKRNAVKPRYEPTSAERDALKWAKDNGLRAIELGGRMHSSGRYETVDLKDADICCDLEQPWPFEDSSVGVIRAADVFEHLRDPIHTMKECYRVMAPGAMLMLQVPSTEGRGAFQDPTHKSYWNENSLLYWSDQRWARFIDTPVRFQMPFCRTTEKDARGVCWVQAHLISLKDGYRPVGEINI